MAVSEEERDDVEAWALPGHVDERNGDEREDMERGSEKRTTIRTKKIK